MKNLILQLVINSDMQMSEVENMDWNTVVTFLLSDLMIIIYECAGCVILLLLVLRFSRKKKAVIKEMEEMAEREKKNQLDSLLKNEKRG